MMAASADDSRWMRAAIALSRRGAGRTAPNPNVGCLLVKRGRIVARGWTQPTGRPHAEAMALAAAGDAARGATAYVTLEPCAHTSDRGPTCTDSLIAAGLSRIVVATRDPDPRTNGQGLARLAAAGMVVSDGVMANEARAAMAGWWTRTTQGRAHVTLKLATSLDGCIALASGESRWITSEAARRHTHLLRAKSDGILVGRGTWETDHPRLDVRLPGLEDRSPQRLILTRSAPTRGGGSGDADEGGETRITSPQAATQLPHINHLLVEGGSQTAAAFLRAGLVDRLILYRAPILIGGAKPCLADLGLTALADAHGQWQLADARQLGPDRVEIYERAGQGR
jgi:diaminohydroxyphosphoribosylaminopyrimidine deaminase/5-amino-6-(5-phosphoribosylamino)uracil reductase